MLEYVHKKLEEANAIQPRNPLHFFRSRFSHIQRVLGWCKRIHTDLLVDEEVLYTAAIFHDVGYSMGKNGHAESSAKIFEEYAKNQGLDTLFIEKVASVIRNHSDKERLGKDLLSNELVLLMEADLLDEEGALGFVWDFMAIGAKGDTTYYDSIEACKHSAHILEQDYMITPLAKMYWEKKKILVKEFIDALEKDLFVGE